MKICITCKLPKEISEFYVHKRMEDGHLNKCKTCIKEYAKSNYEMKIQTIPEFAEKERERARDKYRRLYRYDKADPVAKKVAIANYTEKYPEKFEAKAKSASLIKPFADANKHHWSYNQEHYLDVIWLTVYEHGKAHRFLIYDQERMMYRKYDTNELLDNKEKHEIFIRECILNKPD